jgi:hypothetical protein
MLIADHSGLFNFFDLSLVAFSNIKRAEILGRLGVVVTVKVMLGGNRFRGDDVED